MGGGAGVWVGEGMRVLGTGLGKRVEVAEGRMTTGEGVNKVNGPSEER
jgi:hypothetical protein